MGLISAFSFSSFLSASSRTTIGGWATSAHAHATNLVLTSLLDASRRVEVDLLMTSFRKREPSFHSGVRGKHQPPP